MAARILRLKPKQIPPTCPAIAAATTTTADDGQQRCRVALVTGSNTGVGYQTAKALVLDHGFEVIVACRSPQKGIEACREINMAATTTSNSKGKAVFLQPLDLADLNSVRDFCRVINIHYDRIDVLVNNAGRNSAGIETEQLSGALPSSTMTDLVFRTNFLGHFLRTNLLLDKSQRIVNLASVMHHFPVYSKMDHDTFGSMQYLRANALEPVAVDGGGVRKVYGPSKFAALLFSTELNRRYRKCLGVFNPLP
eukprot:scaffold31792_cov168-Amphora_coffeaeformis.AAC.15